VGDQPDLVVVADEFARCVEGEELLEWFLAYSAEHGFDGFYLPVLGARVRLGLEP
jgi:hypothetical protein